MLSRAVISGSSVMCRGCQAAAADRAHRALAGLPAGWRRRGARDTSCTWQAGPGSVQR